MRQYRSLHAFQAAPEPLDAREFSYHDRAFQASPPHGSDHECFTCADGRRAIGHRALEPELARRARLMRERDARVRHFPEPTLTAWVGLGAICGIVAALWLT